MVAGEIEVLRVLNSEGEPDGIFHRNLPETVAYIAPLRLYVRDE